MQKLTIHRILSENMSTNSTGYLALKRTPRISNSQEMDKDLLELIQFVEDYRGSWIYKVVNKLKRR